MKELSQELNNIPSTNPNNPHNRPYFMDNMNTNEDDNNCYFIMEYAANGNLYHHLSNNAYEIKSEHK